VPEVVDRIRLLTGHLTEEKYDVAALKYQAGLPDLDRTTGLTVPSGPLLLAGYSQGSVIAPAVVAQLPAGVLPDVALLTLACPAQRLYGRAFPAYFGQRQLTELARLLDADSKPGRWKNLRRRSDYIGSFIFAVRSAATFCTLPRLDSEKPREQWRHRRGQRSLIMIVTTRILHTPTSAYLDRSNSVWHTAAAGFIAISVAKFRPGAQRPTLCW
jgi:hypothetical protein